ncbi:(RS)-norcoclaurine 6-O-methyltransferase [Leucoagaricus sp. SymC.cos]|nr:(RS)-norcoclaurine 6-O-methyltransferase [Leucoagaricus sp. SymC.cos]
MSSPVELVNKLQKKLVVSSYSGAGADPFQFYKTKSHISYLHYDQFKAQRSIAELIAASPDGKLSLSELSSKTNADENYISVALSLLLYHGYFVEVDNSGPHVYANNELGDLLRTDTSKRMERAWRMPLACPTTCLLDVATRKGGPNKGPLQTFSSTSPAVLLSGWLLLETNDVAGEPVKPWFSFTVWRTVALEKVLYSVTIQQPLTLTEIADYLWENLATPIVDVGGRVGSFEEMLFSVPKNEELRFIIFDIETTIDNAKKVGCFFRTFCLYFIVNFLEQAWAAKPQWMQDRVSFVAGDFFQSSAAESKIPTPAEGGGTYVIRHVLHDWDDVQVVRILTNVRNAMLATPTPEPPKLLLVEMMLNETSSRFTRTTSLQVLVINGGVTRTEVQFRKLIEEAEFLVENVTEVRGVDLVVELRPKA